MLLLGQTELVGRDPQGSISDFTIALRSIEAHLSSSGVPPLLRLLQANAYNDRGVARLWLLQRRPDERPDCRAHETGCRAALTDFGEALHLDATNPYYLLNHGWTNLLLGDRRAAQTELDAALADDSREYPAANDLGVLYARLGDTGRARKLFQVALRAQPAYDLAAWNLGILSMTDGPVGTVAGQTYLARAIAANPALRDAALRYRTDERFYQAYQNSSQSLDAGSPAGQAYSTEAVLSGVVRLAVLLNRQMGGELSEWGMELLPKLPWPALAQRVQLGWRRVRPRSLQSPAKVRERRTRVILLWAPTLALMAVSTAWMALTSAGDTGVAFAGLSLLAVASALLVQQSAQLIISRSLGARLLPAVCVHGIAFSVFLQGLRAVGVPLLDGPFTGGPLMGWRLAPGVPLDRARWALVGGPAANLVAAVTAFGLHAVSPLPLLWLLMQAQLATAAFALLPFKPLNGAVISEPRRFPFLLLPMSLWLAIIVAGALLKAGRL